MTARRHQGRSWGVTASALAFALVLCALPATLSAAEPAGEAEVERLLEEAYALFEQQNTDAEGAERMIAAWEAVLTAARRIAPDHPQIARTDIRVASQLYGLGRNAEARALEMLAIILSRTGRPVEATGYLARSLELKREHEGPDSLFFGYGLHLLGTIYHQRERYGDAVPLFEEAAPIFAKYQGEGSPFGLGAQGYAAQGTFALGRAEEALGRLRAVDARMESQTVDVEIAKRIGPDLVRALIRNGETAEAVRIAARDYARLLETENSGAFALRHARLVDVWAQSIVAGEPQDALAEARAMIAFLGRDRARGQAGQLLAEQRAALDLVMEIAVAAGAPDAMVQAIQLATGSGLAQASAFRAERLATGDPGLAGALKALQEADAELDAADRELLRALAAGSPAEAARARLAAADAARTAALADLGARDASTGKLLGPEAADIAAIRAGLGKDEALLAIAPAYDGACSLVVTADQALIRRLDLPRAELVALAAGVRDAAAGLDFDRAAAARLAAVLLPPETRAALGRVKTLRVLVGGPLASLPFGLLVLGEGSRGQGPTWLADRFALANVAALGDAGRAEGQRGSGLVALPRRCRSLRMRGPRRGPRRASRPCSARRPISSAAGPMRRGWRSSPRCPAPNARPGPSRANSARTARGCSSAIRRARPISPIPGCARPKCCCSPPMASLQASLRALPNRR